MDRKRSDNNRQLIQPDAFARFFKLTAIFSIVASLAYGIVLPLIQLKWELTDEVQDLLLSFTEVTVLICVYILLRATLRYRNAIDTMKKSEESRGLLATRVQNWLLQLEESHEDLRMAQRAAEKANAAKTDFLAKMSHEIRTPMNGILGLTSLALDRVESDEQRENLELVRDSAMTLLTLINDILDFSKIEARKLTLKHEPTEILPLVQRTIRLLRPIAEKKNIRLTSNFQGALPRALMGDQVRITQILNNLVGNALKFTPEGGSVEIKIIARSEELHPDRMSISFVVKDSGIGISDGDISRIFLPFEQVDDVRVNKLGGTGLGLAITRHLVELMGGSLEVESTIGVGSSFIVHLSLDRAPAAVVAPTGRTGEFQSLQFQGKRVLVAEDNIINQKVIKKILESLGFEATIVGDGEKAVEATQSHKFDIIILDCQMPVLDGYEAARKIRGDERAGDLHVPVVALTAHALPEDKDKCLEAGMDAYLTKPIDREALMQTLAQLLASEG